MNFVQKIKSTITENLPILRNKGLSTVDNTFVVKSWSDLKATISPVTSTTDPTSLSPTITPTVAINKYRSWVYPCVNLISGKVSTVPYYLYQEIGQPNDEEYNRILDHPCVKLLKRPNKTQSGRLFKTIIQMHLDLCGVAFARIMRNGAGVPAELHILNPHELVTIEFGNNTNEIYKKFVFAPMGNRFSRIELPYEDVLYFYYPHPANPYLPCTPIQTLAHVTDIDLFLQVYEKAFFLNNARPDFIIVGKGDITPDQAEQMMATWDAKHRGPGKSHRPVILSQDARVEQIALSARDFEFLALSEWTKDQILSAYMVPEAMLGLYESFNRASSITAETTFVKSSIEPRLFLFEDVINTQLLPQFKGTSGLEFKHESALPKDDEWELTRNTAELQSGLITINEIRKRKGQKPFKSKLCDVPWIGGQPIAGVDEEADKMWKETQLGGAAAAMPPGMGGMGGAVPPETMAAVPEAQGAMGQLGGRPPGNELSTLLHEALRTAKPSLSMLLNASRGRRGGLAALLASHPDMGNFGALLQNDRMDSTLGRLITRGIHDYINETLSEEDKVVFKIYEENAVEADEIENNLIEKIEKFYVQKGSEFADIVEKALDNFVTKEPFGDIDEEEYKSAYKEMLGYHIDKAIKLGVNMGYRLVKKEPAEDTAIEVASDAAGRFLDKSSDLSTRSVKKTLTKIISEGIESGRGINDITEEIRTKFASMPAHRAATIARTEVAGAMDAGVDASFEQINDESGKVVIKKAVLWTALDERTCKECEEEHSKVVKDYETGEEFIEIPIHPNCRCIRIPVR